MPLSNLYPWINGQKPLVVSAPMMKISLAEYALATSSAGGIGFLAGGFDLKPLFDDLAQASELLDNGTYSNLSRHKGLLPIGVGVQNWGSDLSLFIEALKTYTPMAVWFFAPKEIPDLVRWAQSVRELNPAIQVWVQIGTVAEAVQVAELVKPDILVVQGADAGGHGLAQRAGIITLLPEIRQTLHQKGHDIPLVAAGGISEGRSTAAAVCLGAVGVCMGTRFLASHEAKISKGYQNEVLRASDGGTSTAHSTVYDRVRGINGWPASYDGRGVINQSYVDAEAGMPDKENQQLYTEEMKKGDQGWGPHGRMTTYAGTGVGLVTDVLSIAEIVKKVQDEAVSILKAGAQQWQ